MIAAVALLCATAANAQDEKDSEAYNFIGVQAGGQVTLTHYNIGKLITPQFAIQFGHYFNDKLGARLHIMGYQNKGGFKADRFNLSEDKAYKFKACTADLDLLMNLTNTFNPNRTNRAFDWVLVCGVGVNYGWDYKEFNNIVDLEKNNPTFTAYNAAYPMSGSGKTTCFNLRVGTQFNYNISDAWQVGLEIQGNAKGDTYNHKINEKCDWQIAALLGITYKLGKKAKPAPVAEPVYATRVDTVWYDDTEYKTAPSEDRLERTIHYTICKAAPIDEAIVAEVADFVKSHKDAKVTVTGYADKGTGNPKINMKYSKQRAEAVADALRNAGVEVDIINVDYKGDTVQPFAENDLNRATITVATGTGEKQTPVKVKKFRTEEVRYEVK